MKVAKRSIEREWVIQKSYLFFRYNALTMLPVFIGKRKFESVLTQPRPNHSLNFRYMLKDFKMIAFI